MPKARRGAPQPRAPAAWASLGLSLLCVFENRLLTDHLARLNAIAHHEVHPIFRQTGLRRTTRRSERGSQTNLIGYWTPAQITQRNNPFLQDDRPAAARHAALSFFVNDRGIDRASSQPPRARGQNDVELEPDRQYPYKSSHQESSPPSNRELG